MDNRHELQEKSFSLGRITITLPAARELAMANVHMFTLVARHALHDWGIARAEENRRALESGDVLVSGYILSVTDVEVWIVTDKARTETLVCLADEYSNAL